MTTKLQVGKPIAINSVEGATITDGVSVIGGLRPNEDGTWLVAMHYFASVEDIGGQPIAFENFNIDLPNIENQILAQAKTLPSLDAATDIA